MKPGATWKLAILTAFALVDTAYAVNIASITRLKGQHTNRLVAMGLVVGLKGTGDGGKFLPAIRPLAEMLSKLHDAVNVNELKDARNVALVSVVVVIPDDGVQPGERLDVQVASLGAAKSLKGGRLFLTPLQGPLPSDPVVYGWAEGPVSIVNPETPTVGVVQQGAVMEEQILNHYISPSGKFTLVINPSHASWRVANTIAKIINDYEAGSAAEPAAAPVAVALGPKTVEVTIPQPERANPAGFISRILGLTVLLPEPEARVLIDETHGTILIDGNVEISPVIIRHKNLTITTLVPAPKPDPRKPLVKQKRFVALDPAKEGGPKLQQLIESLDALQVPAEDAIAIVKKLHEMGKIHAELVVEN